MNDTDAIEESGNQCFSSSFLESYISRQMFPCKTISGDRTVRFHSVHTRIHRYHPHDFRGIDYLNEDLERMLRVEDTRAKLITPKVLSNKLVERQ